MVTGFHISPGYAYNKDAKITVGQILDIAKTIPMDKFKEKLMEYGLDGPIVKSFVKLYSTLPTEDATFIVCENDVLQLASGGGKIRRDKEIARRAFSILLLDECFKQGKNICLSIS